MRLEEVLPALRAGQAIQRTSHPASWAYLTRSENGAFHWYGFGDDPKRGSPMSLSHEDIDAVDWVVVDPAIAAARKPAGTMNCPRRHAAFADSPKDYWRSNGTCSHCGSVNPDTLMARLEAGDVQLGPTDKNYKVYVDNKGGDPIGIKFYFMHLSNAQMLRFIELHNEKKLHIEGGGFYCWPYFMAPVGG